MLEKLKQYKEVIAIVVFFLGGLFWITDRYPTKDDLKSQVHVLQCLLDNYMELTQLQINNQQSWKALDALERQLQSATDPTAPGVTLSPALSASLAELSQERDAKRSELKKLAADMQAIRNKLERNVCGKEGA